MARYIKAREINAAQLGLNGETVLAASPVTSSVINVEGYNQLTVNIAWTYAAATSVRIDMYSTNDPSDTTTGRHTQKTTATGTDSDLNRDHAIAAASDYWTINCPINYQHVYFIVTSTGGTTDTITATVRLAAV